MKDGLCHANISNAVFKKKQFPGARVIERQSLSLDTSRNRRRNLSDENPIKQNKFMSTGITAPVGSNMAVDEIN